MIRPANRDDLDAIMALERASFPTDAWSAASMGAELASPHTWYIVDEEAGRVLGYGGLRSVQGAVDADIQTIAIAESSRGRGRGRTLLRSMLAEAARRGARDLFLEVRADNPVAHALYASEGFFDIGRRPRYYQPDDVDAVMMKLDVRGWAAHHMAPASELGAVPATRSSEKTAELGADRPDTPNVAQNSEFRDTARDSEETAGPTSPLLRPFGNAVRDGGVCT